MSCRRRRLRYNGRPCDLARDICPRRPSGLRLTSGHGRAKGCRSIAGVGSAPDSKHRRHAPDSKPRRYTPDRRWVLEAARNTIFVYPTHGCCSVRKIGKPACVQPSTALYIRECTLYADIPCHTARVVS